MAVKRQSAFNRALREAQTAPLAPAVESEPPPGEVEEQVLGRPVAQAPTSVEGGEKPSTRNKGGRPRSVVAKKKFTYYLREDSDENITSIKKALVRHADLLVDDKGEVVEQALEVMRFALEDEQSRNSFLQIYRRWQASAN